MLYNITNIINIESYILFITKSLIQDKLGRQRKLLACIVCLRILGVGVETGELFAAWLRCRFLENAKNNTVMLF